MRTLALVIFGITYLLLAVGRLRPFRLDRTGIAITGTGAMILTGVVPLRAPSRPSTIAHWCCCSA
jgi:hypothetical protein